MKRLFLPIILLLLCAAACTVPTENTNINASNANAANSNAVATAPSWTNDDIIANDKRAWDFIKSKDSAGFAAILADEFIDVTPQKIYDKAGTIEEVKPFDLTETNLSDFKVIRVDKDAAIVTYTVRLKGSIGGKPIPADAPAERHSTATVLRGGKWLAVYHQSTPIAPPPPPPAAGSAANANKANANTANANTAVTTASPAASMTTADAEANERMVWDMLQKKNFDGFAAMLAEDMLEVEPDSVSDKAASVNGVKQYFGGTATFTLSDFKTIVLDEDAKLVTYTVKSSTKGFNPAGERHSSIWVNRNGKWLAVFHQGTLIVNPAS